MIEIETAFYYLIIDRIYTHMYMANYYGKRCDLEVGSNWVLLSHQCGRSTFDLILMTSWA